jgi:hypothetical protein
LSFVLLPLDFLVTFVVGGMSLVLSSLLPQPKMKLPNRGIERIAAVNRNRRMIILRSRKSLLRV